MSIEHRAARHARSFGELVPSAIEYLVDAGQRTALYWDTMRRRGNQFNARLTEPAPHVLDYKGESLIDGRSLDRPVNYALVRILPPEGMEIDPSRRPFVVIDPRAGHGPGIAGFKSDSEIGVALKAGHPCYFIGFLPRPVPGQTIEDIIRAEAVFIERVGELHRHADGKPCVIGNCQAGWALAMLAARRPELFGPVILAGSPLSYWGGVHGQYPMRYSAGLLGGSWLTALTSDLGDGIFDGAWLVQNFENQNPANTSWSKPYRLYANIDTEASRYLGFERWWGSHVDLNAEEIQFIVDELFIGNKLAAGHIKGSDGISVDLRNIRSPIVVFCSKGDNITPPQQALGWILDLYGSEEEIRRHEQTIVYTIHGDVGHLGIFVSSSVARKEYAGFSSNIDLIELLPPGLYEAVFEPNAEEEAGGEWIMRCEARTFDDLRAMGGNDAEDDRRFATVARVSEANLALYRSVAQPLVRALTSSASAERLRRAHPLRVRYEVLSDQNPLMAAVPPLAEQAKAERRPVRPDHPWLALETSLSRQIVGTLEAWRSLCETAAEVTFSAVYGSPWLQAAMGVDGSRTAAAWRAGKTPLHEERLRERIAAVSGRLQAGGLREAAVRALIYVGRERSTVDQREFEAVRRMRAAHDEFRKLGLAEFKSLVRDQSLMLDLDPAAALEALPDMLPDKHERHLVVGLLRQIFTASGDVDVTVLARLDRLGALLGVPGGAERRSHDEPRVTVIEAASRAS